MTKHRVFLGLGSNLGHRKSNMRKAIGLIRSRVGAVLRQSSYVDSKPWGFKSQHRFLNAVVMVETELTPHEVLELTQQIERDMGRIEKSEDGQYADRIIDIDILLYDNLTLDDADLKIPHPLMQQRDFVMTPLREIASVEIPGQMPFSESVTI